MMFYYVRRGKSILVVLTCSLFIICYVLRGTQPEEDYTISRVPNMMICIYSSLIIYYYIYSIFYLLLFLFGGVLFIPSRNLDEVFTYFPYIAYIMSLRGRSHVKASMVLTRADHLFIHNYIRSLLNNILRPIL